MLKQNALNLTKDQEKFVNDGNVMPISFIQNNIEEHCRSLSYAKRRLFDYFLDLTRKGHRLIYVSQQTLADHLGVSRKHINESLQEFKAAGFLISLYRHKRTCLYKVSSYFFQPIIKSRLSHIFRSLGYLCLSLLIPQTSIGSTPSGEVTQLIIKKGYIYKSLSSSTSHNTKKETTSAFKGQDFFNKKLILEKRWVPTQEVKHMLTQQQTNVLFKLKHGEPFPISPVLRSLTDELKLTKWGQVRLSMFPDEALLWAYERLQSAKGIENKFGWFWTVCETYCRENKIAPDFKWSYRLGQACQMPENAKMVREYIPMPSKKPKVIIADPNPIEYLPPRTETPDFPASTRDLEAQPKYTPYKNKYDSRQQIQDKPRQTTKMQLRTQDGRILLVDRPLGNYAYKEPEKEVVNHEALDRIKKMQEEGKFKKSTESLGFDIGDFLTSILHKKMFDSVPPL